MNFITIKEKVEAEIVEKKSSFIANFFPIDSANEAEEIIKELKKKYHDARHNCIAYRVIENEQIIEKSSDDGEPSGTAGAPMLNILQKNNLANVLVVVTRYFGGILLGTGGLVRAYSDSLLKAIEKSKKLEKCLGLEMFASLDYAQFDIFKHYCMINDIFITNVEFGELISCKLELEETKKEKMWEDFDTKNIILRELKELTKKYISKSI